MTWLLKRKRKRYENLNLNKVVMEMVISIAKKSDLEDILVKQRLMLIKVITNNVLCEELRSPYKCI